MIEALGGSIGYALGIAISPIPIAALLLTLLSLRPRSGSVAFTVGWIAGITAATTVGAVTPWFDAGDDPSDARGWLRASVGAILLVAAARRWRTRPRPGDEPPVPPLMRALDGMTAPGVLGVGFALAALNPKDLVLATAGGVEIASADLTTAGASAAIAAFVTIAGSTALVPVGAYLVAGSRLDDRLHRARRWLIDHNAVVMTIVLGVLGALFVAEGVAILLD